MSKVYLATKEDLNNIEGVKTFDSKEAYEAAKTAGEIKDGEVVGYPYEGEAVGTPIDKELSETSENPVQNKVVYAQFTNIANEIVNLKNSVSNGKTLVANAITEKGVATESTDEFSVMASNIALIETGKKTLVLPTNPDLSIQSDDSALTLSWTQPETEVEVDHYNIYTSLSEPSSLKDMELVGSVNYSRNLLDSTMYSSTSFSEILPNEYTSSGITFTRNEDGSITANGTATGGISVFLKPSELENGTYTLSGCPSNGSSTSYFIRWYADGSYDEFGDGITVNISSNPSTQYVQIFIANGTTINETFYPQIEKGSVKTSYEEYTPTLYELTNLTNNQTYYVGIQSVTEEGYENASIWKVQNGVPSTIRFVAVGNGGKSYYSTDGINWVAMSGLNTSIDYRGVTYGNDRFVTVGLSGYSYYSTDGINWVAMSKPGSDSIYGVTYGNGKFVNVGYHKAYYSTDGVNWTAASGIGSYSYNGVTYGNGRFVAVGNDGSSYYSTNGTNWVAMSGLNTSRSYLAVTYGNGRFVCVGGSGKSYYSTDGINWVAMSGLNTSIDYRSVTYGNGRFVCVGDSGKSYYSTNGTNWVAMSGLDASTACRAVTYGNRRFVCVGNYGKSYYSTDGVNWVAMSGLNTSYAYHTVTNNKWNKG